MLSFLVADRCAVADYFDLGLAPLGLNNSFQLACAKQKTSSQEVRWPISGCLTFCQHAWPVSVCLISDH